MLLDGVAVVSEIEGLSTELNLVNRSIAARVMELTADLGRRVDLVNDTTATRLSALADGLGNGDGALAARLDRLNETIVAAGGPRAARDRGLVSKQ